VVFVAIFHVDITFGAEIPSEILGPSRAVHGWDWKHLDLRVVHLDLLLVGESHWIVLRHHLVWFFEIRIHIVGAIWPNQLLARGDDLLLSWWRPMNTSLSRHELIAIVIDLDGMLFFCILVFICGFRLDLLNKFSTCTLVVMLIGSWVQRIRHLIIHLVTMVVSMCGIIVVDELSADSDGAEVVYLRWEELTCIVKVLDVRLVWLYWNPTFEYSCILDWLWRELLIWIWAPGEPAVICWSDCFHIIIRLSLDQSSKVWASLVTSLVLGKLAVSV